MKSPKNISTFAIIATVLLVYWIGVFRHIELPGIYMDAINPDYLVAHRLNPALNNPGWILPSAWFPILGNLYHGVQNFYIGLPIYWLLGASVVSARIVHALFGAVIIALVFFLGLRTTGSRLLAAAAALCLATDIAFIASFRTQNYIILGGQVWLMASLLLLFPKDLQLISKKRLLFSGVLFGLAIYGYFVFTFFLPAAFYIVTRTTGTRRIRSTAIWFSGMVIGMIPYAIGYLSMLLALDGTDKLLEYLRTATNTLAPLSSKLSFSASYGYMLSMVNLAIINGGNELLIFGEYISVSAWTASKYFFFLATLALLLAILTTRKNSQEKFKGFLLVLLPCSYMLVAGILGTRLGAHHFSVLIPFLYLLAAVLFNECAKLMTHTSLGNRSFVLQHRAIVTAVVITLVGNVIQQQKFFTQLDLSGGKGLATNALTTLANDALSGPSDTVYLFPEWGFFMSFAFLTESRVPYWFEASKHGIERLRGQYKYVSIPFWKEDDASKYKALLQSAGAGEISMRTLYRRDGKPGFYMVTAPI